MSATLDEETGNPMAILRNARTGQVRGFLRDLPAETLTREDAVAVASPGPETRLRFSRGGRPGRMAAVLGAGRTPVTENGTPGPGRPRRIGTTPVGPARLRLAANPDLLRRLPGPSRPLPPRTGPARSGRVYGGSQLPGEVTAGTLPT